MEDDAKMIGARHDDSVLFTLDALKAGAAKGGVAGPQAPAPPPPKPGSLAYGAGDTSASADDFLGIGGAAGGPQLFAPAADQALLTAPAPEPEPPKKKTAESVAPASVAPLSLAKRSDALKLALLGGAMAMLVVVALVGGIVLGRSGGEQELAKTDTAEDQGAGATEAKGEAKPDEKKGEVSASEADKQDPKEEKGKAAEEIEALASELLRRTAN